MSDTTVNYQGVADGARKLREVRRQVDEDTNQLQQKIQNLTNSPEFSTDAGSGALQQSITRFGQAKETAMGALDKMIAYLESIPGMYQQADNQYKSIFDRYNPG